jgi:hypothetical protein
MAGAFYHFWLAERQDVAVPAGTMLPTLPIGPITTEFLRYQSQIPTYAGPTLKGEFSILSLNARSGRVLVNDDGMFDCPTLPIIQFYPFDPKYGPPPIVYSPQYPYAVNMRGFSSMP